VHGRRRWTRPNGNGFCGYELEAGDYVLELKRDAHTPAACEGASTTYRVEEPLAIERDPVTGAVGAVHAGWRGTVADIAGNAVRAMAEHFGSCPENIRAAIGPNIGVCCFETHADVPDAVRAVLGEKAEGFIVPAGEKFRVDLKGVNAALLRRAGVRHIEISDACTACEPERFWSHRRVGNDRGSLAAIIVCEGGMTK
jgi:YfiH family protein